MLTVNMDAVCNSRQGLRLSHPDYAGLPQSAPAHSAACATEREVLQRGRACYATDDASPEQARSLPDGLWCCTAYAQHFRSC